MVIPGLTTNDASTIPLRSYLGGLGYECRGWGLGVNSGDVATQLPQTIERVATWCAERGEPIALVGWSLGGVIAREVTRVRPDIVERVITFGTPAVGSASHHDVDVAPHRSPPRDRSAGAGPQQHADPAAGHGDLQPQRRRGALEGVRRP